MRPTTALSDQGILEQVLSNTTPKVELNNPVESHVYNQTPAMNISSDSAYAKENKENGRMSSVAESDDEEERPVTAKTRNGKEKVFDLRETEGGMFTMES